MCGQSQGQSGAFIASHVISSACESMVCQKGANMRHVQKYVNCSTLLAAHAFDT
jgi:hypothetical protein